MADLLTVDIADGVAVLTLNDPGRRNALTSPLVAEIVAAVAEVEQPSSGVAAIVVTGAAPAFCAGADLSDLGASRDSRSTGLRGIYEGFLAVSRSPLLTIAAVNGAAVGAGMNLALGCDIRIASTRAKFDTRFLQLGLHPGGGHTWMLQRIVGQQAAMAMLLGGQIIDGTEAERIGLVYRTVAEDALLETAIDLGRRCAEGPHELVRRLKATVQELASEDTHDAAVDRELETQLWSLDQPDFAERLAAMQKKITSK